MQHALSVDVEEWYHATAIEANWRPGPGHEPESRVMESTTRLLQILEEADVRGTFFVLGCVAEAHPELPRMIVAHGHEIGVHGHTHKLLTDQTAAEFRETITRAIGVCEDLSGEKILGYRAPSLSLTDATDWALDVLIELGIRYDSSLTSAYADGPSPYWLTRPGGGRIQEYPIVGQRLLALPVPMASGGYFRLYPYGFTRYLLRRFEKQGVPANVFLHPWEIDVDHPRPAGLGRVSVLRHYINLHTVEGKLKRLLRDFRVAPLKRILETRLPEPFAGQRNETAQPVPPTGRRA